MSRSPVEVVDHSGMVGAHEAVVRLVEAVLEAEKVEGSVVVAFVGEEVIGELNGRYRGRPEPTDVLSFAEEEGARWPGEMDELGEIVICPRVVLRYSREEGVTFQEQLGWTLVHGVLHLLGHDHETDHGEMRERECQILASLQSLVRDLAPAVSGQEGEDSRP